MPTVKDIPGSYRFFFYSFDCNEPMHVQKERMVCKFWIEPVVLSKNYGFTSKELNTIREIICNDKEKIVEAWYEHCGKTSRSKH